MVRVEYIRHVAVVRRIPGDRMIVDRYGECRIDEFLVRRKSFLKHVVLRITEFQLIAFFYIDGTRIGVHKFAFLSRDPIQKHVGVLDLGDFDSQINDLGEFLFFVQHQRDYNP
jgi:hypothetical protein